MKVEQISIFLENKPGRLSEVTKILSDAAVNIRALSIADTSDFGVLRLIVDDNRKAENALKGGDFTVKKTDVLAVEVEDRPGGLHHILELLEKQNINVEYMYAFVHPSGDNAVMIFRFDHINEALNALEANGVKVVDGDTLYAM